MASGRVKKSARRGLSQPKTFILASFNIRKSPRAAPMVAKSIKGADGQSRNARCDLPDLPSLHVFFCQHYKTATEYRTWTPLCSTYVKNICSKSHCQTHRGDLYQMWQSGMASRRHDWTTRRAVVQPKPRECTRRVSWRGIAPPDWRNMEHRALSRGKPLVQLKNAIILDMWKLLPFPVSVSGAGDSRARFRVVRVGGGRGMGLISIHFQRREWLLRLLGLC